VERGCAAWELEVRKRMQTMLQVWQKAPYISPKGGRQKGMPQDSNTKAFLLQIFIARKNKNARSPNDYAGELKSW